MLKHKNYNIKLNKVFLFILILCCFFTPSTCIAGGDGSLVKILTFKFKGNNEFILELENLDSSGGIFSPLSKEDKVFLHLRYKPTYFFQGHLNRKATNFETYKNGVNLLLKKFKSSKSFTLGRMGDGFIYILDTQNHFQSNSLHIYDGIVYSFD